MLVYIVYEMSHDGIQEIFGVYSDKTKAEKFVKRMDEEHWNRLPNDTKEYFQNDIIKYPSSLYITKFELK